MSCRVLKRGTEEFVINKVMQLARENGFKRVLGEYLKTPKNAMVEHIYEQMGFNALGNGKFEMIVDEYKPKKTYIVEE